MTICRVDLLSVNLRIYYQYRNLKIIFYYKSRSKACSIYDIIHFITNKTLYEGSTKEKPSIGINSTFNNTDKSNIEASQAEEATAIEIKRTL